MAEVQSGMMEKSNKAVVLHGKMDMRLEDIGVPKTVDQDDVLIQMNCVGICASDIKYWTQGYCGIFTVKEPMVIGHEGCGKIVQVGDKVKTFQVGDMVAIEPGVPCRKCQLCRTGKYNLCPEMQFCATPPVHGNLCQYFTHPADFCYKLPDGVQPETGALMEPLAVAIHACRKGHVGPGSNVLICGAGPVGILCLWVAKNFGASKVVLTDIDPFRMAFARAEGADDVINVSGVDEKEAANKVKAAIGVQPDVTIECSGSDYSMALGIHATYPGGSVIQVGRGSAKPEVPLNVAATKEVDIRGVFRYANCYPIGLEMIKQGRLPRLMHLVTHRFSLAESQTAFQVAMSRDEKSIKVLIHCP